MRNSHRPGAEAEGRISDLPPRNFLILVRFWEFSADMKAFKSAALGIFSDNRPPISGT
jgi:hypothetical protein